MFVRPGVFYNGLSFIADSHFDHRGMHIFQKDHMPCIYAGLLHLEMEVVIQTIEDISSPLSSSPIVWGPMVITKIPS